MRSPDGPKLVLCKTIAPKSAAQEFESWVLNLLGPIHLVRGADGQDCEFGQARSFSCGSDAANDNRKNSGALTLINGIVSDVLAAKVNSKTILLIVSDEMANANVPGTEKAKS